MKKGFILLLSLLLAFATDSFSQKELIISGGSSVSSLVCSNNYVFVTGSNKTQNGSGTLGVGSTADKVSEWTQVIFPNNETIQQVNSGSGQSFIALSCGNSGNKVWCWGDNASGQCGTGTIGGIVTSPQQVVAGCMAGTAYDCDGYLCNVDVVYAGNANSFAILGDGPYKGQVVAWGGNMKAYESSLGVGHNNQTSAPEWCIDLDGNKISNIVQIFSGDDGTLALDADGHVWSCGAVQKTSTGLGRLAAGGYCAPDGNNGGPSNKFGLVYVGAGEPLSNIVQIAAGDVAYMALDKDGYIWSWGDTWNHACGQGANVGSSSPKKVVKGDTDDEDNDGTYLLAKSVGAGQSSGMAVSITGKPVTWGAYCGQGATETAEVPGYVQYAAGAVHEDVILINKGDQWGFYGRADGSMYAWGNNDNGQLGTTTASYKYATKIQPPTTCNSFKDPKPSAAITPKSKQVCASGFTGETLDCGFMLTSASLLDSYTITWYKDGTQVSTGNGSNYQYETEDSEDGLGTYSVKIEYVGHNSGCETYDAAEDEITISAYEQEFTVPELEYCGDSATVKVNAGNPNAVYSWYSSKGANATPIATTTGSGSEKIYIGNLMMPSTGTRTIYVEETSKNSGYLVPNPGSGSTQAIGQSFAAPGLLFEETTVLESMNATLTAALSCGYTSGNTAYETEEEALAQTKELSGSVTMTIGIYGARVNNQKYVADASNLIKTITKKLDYTYSYKATSTQSQYNGTTQTNWYKPVWSNADNLATTEVVEIPVGLELGSGYYYIAVTMTSSGSINTNNTKLAKYTGFTGQVDNMNGKVSFYGSTTNGVSSGNYSNQDAGPFYNFKLTAGQGFCDRIEATITENCPCEDPDEFEILSDDAALYTDGTIYICENDQECTLTTDNWCSETETQFTYAWSKDGTPLTASAISYTSDPLTVTEAGTYTILVKDKEATGTACQIEKEVNVVIIPTPTVNISGGGEYCYGGEFTDDVVLTMTGSPNFTGYYNLSVDGGTAKKKKARTESTTFTIERPTEVGTYVYTLVSIDDDWGCKNTNVSGTATITVKPNPTATIKADKTEACEGDAITLSVTSDIDGSTFVWTKDGSEVGTNATKTLTASSESGTYHVKATADGCESEEVSKDITIYEIPTITKITVDDNAVCSGETIELTSTVSEEGGEYTWSNNVEANGKTATISKEVTTTTEETVTLTYSLNGCESEQYTTSVTFYAKPSAPSVEDQSYCVDDDAKAFKVTADGELNWYTTLTGGTASSVTPTANTSEAAVTKYYVSQVVNDCESDRATLTVQVDDTLAPAITATSFELCEKATVKLAVDEYETILWEGTGAVNLDATSIATPTFTATTAGTYKVKVSVVDSKGCEGSAVKEITVNPIPTVTLSSLTDECNSDETAQTITATISPDVDGVGTWTGDVTDKENTTAKFTPSSVTAGTYEIKYDFTSDKNCKAKQVSTSVEVFSMPSPTLTLSNTNVCVSGDNSETVTSKVTGVTGGTSSFSVDNGGTIDGTTGEFDPTANSEGTYTITLDYEDGNGCKATSTSTVKVNALPVIEFTGNPTEVCYNRAPIDINVTATPEGGKGVWAGTTSSTSATYDPSTASKTTEITYTYTDKNKCVNKESMTITKVSVETPPAITTKTVLKNAGALNDDTDLEGAVATAGDILQWMPEEGGSVLGESTTFSTGKTADDEAGSYKYAVREYRVVNGENCYSDSVIATLVISECNALAPTSQDRFVCVGSDASQEFTATRTLGATPPSQYEIAWLDFDPVGLNGAQTTIHTGETFDPSVATTSASTYVYYVAEYDKDNNCWSAGTKVTLKVVDNPEVTIASPEDICAKGTNEVQVSVSPQNGTLEASTGALNGFAWQPGDYEGSSKEVTFTYTVTSTPYSDGTTCTTVKTSTTTAHFMEAPTGSDNSWLIGQVSTIPDDLLHGTLTSTGEKMNWYDTKALGTLLKENSLTYAPDKDALSTEVEGKTTYSKSWWITQTDAFGCESEASEVTLELLDCPWEAPTAESIEKCIGEDLGGLSASEGTSVTSMSTSGVTSWTWYDKDMSKITSKTTSEFTHGVSNTTAGETTFYVAYSAIEKASSVECQSPKTKVTVNVLPLPEITFEKESEVVCYTTSEVKVNVGASSENGDGQGTWDITGDPDAISQNGIFYPQKNGKTEGQSQYTITYTYTDEKNCSDSKSRTIDVIYLSAPETEGFYALTSQTNPTEVKVTSDLDEGASIKWFENATSTANEKGQGTEWLTGDATDAVMTKSYFARQYKDNCYSEATEAIVKLIKCPIPEVLIDNKTACNYDATPELEATTGGWTERDATKSTFMFYATQDGTAQESADGKWTPTIESSGEYSYYVSEYNSSPVANLTYNEGCEGPKRQVKVTITGTSSPTVTSELTEICKGDNNPIFTASNVVGSVYWYEEDPGELGVPQATKAGEGLSFLTTGKEEGTHSVWAVMFSNGCYGPKAEKTYEVRPIPDAPVTTPSSVCYGEANTPVSASGESGATLTWYSDINKIAKIGTGATYISKENTPAEYTYYASQKVNGCESDAASVTFTIKQLPVAPSVNPQTNLCSYDEAPTLIATGENIKWYSNDRVTVIGQGTELVTTDMTQGTKRYYATQTVDGCEGVFDNVAYTIYAKPEAPVTSGASMCEGATEVPALSTNMSLDKWCLDENATTILATGYNYTPALSAVGSNDLTYYVVREMNDCQSDIVPVTLTVIKTPTFTISNDTTLCIYDTASKVEATNFSPLFNDASHLEWSVKLGKVTKYYDDVDHSLDPTNAITGDGEYKISALYKYVSGNVMCLSDTVSMTYTVLPRPKKPIVFTNVICQGEEIKDLEAIGSPDMVWGGMDGTLPVVCFGNKYKFTPGQTLDTGTYRFVIYDRTIYDEENEIGCKSEIDTVSMTVAPAAKTKLFGADSVCLGGTEQYYTQYTDESTYWWTVTGGNLNYSKDAMSSSVRYVDWTNPGLDTVAVYERTWAGCEGTDTIVVKIATYPDPLFTWEMPGASNIIVYTDSTTQDSLVINDTLKEEVTYKMLWNFGYQGTDDEAIDTTIEYANRFTPIQRDGYTFGFNCPTLKVVNSYGCESTYKECIFVNLATSLYIPTAFAPTNPAHSVRYFQPKGFNLKTCEVSVYDKWGNLIWFSDEVEDGMFVGKWDGRYDGKMMEAGTYIWKIEATFLDDQIWQGLDIGDGKKSKFGNVMLIR